MTRDELGLWGIAGGLIALAVAAVVVAVHTGETVVREARSHADEVAETLGRLRGAR